MQYSEGFWMKPVLSHPENLPNQNRAWPQCLLLYDILSYQLKNPG